jgi:hypothetical protein
MSLDNFVYRIHFGEVEGSIAQLSCGAGEKERKKGREGRQDQP